MVVEAHHLNQIYSDHYANKALHRELQVNEAVTGPLHFYRRVHSCSRRPPFSFIFRAGATVRFFQIKLCHPPQ